MPKKQKKKQKEKEKQEYRENMTPLKEHNITSLLKMQR